ncbi:MAG: M42 family metallopeptidase [Firmicutes bacterium]|nr:M42 family metallopeptidase [Bacillota bacterium]
MLLKKLSEAFGPSGYEHEVRTILEEELKDYVGVWQRDALGNLIACKEAAKGPRVMLAAHMDEVGLMISHVDDAGLLHFHKVGGIDDRVLVSKPVLVGKNRVPGVIGAKAIHLQRPEERTQVIPHRSLFIDIGAKSKDEALAKVKLGDYVIFATEYGEFGEGLAKGKALDDRAGCFVLAEALKEEYNFPLYGAFTVQEEIGLRGAGVAAYAIEPDLGIVIEGTTCNDVSGMEEHEYSTVLGGGPAITFMDTASIGNRAMIQELVRIAEENNIPYQFKGTVTGGNDAGRINVSRAGVPVVAISIPCRYIHSPVSVLSLEDVRNTTKLIKLFLRSIEGGFRV